MINVKLDIKPIPVPLSYQPIYMIVMLLAILRYGCSKPHSATFFKIHLYMWGLKTEQNRKVLLDIKTKKRSSLIPWIFEPALHQVITLGVVNKFCKRKIASKELQIELTEDGKELLIKIEELGLFMDEINQIQSIGILPQNTILAANKNWKLSEDV